MYLVFYLFNLCHIDGKSTDAFLLEWNVCYLKNLRVFCLYKDIGIPGAPTVTYFSAVMILESLHLAITNSYLQTDLGRFLAFPDHFYTEIGSLEHFETHRMPVFARNLSDLR